MQNETKFYFERVLQDQQEAESTKGVRGMFVIDLSEPVGAYNPRLICNFNARIIEGVSRDGHLDDSLVIAGWDNANLPFLAYATREEFLSGMFAARLLAERGIDTATVPGMEYELSTGIYMLTVIEKAVERSRAVLPSRHHLTHPKDDPGQMSLEQVHPAWGTMIAPVGGFQA